MTKKPNGRVRYGVVGLGHIAQVAVLPAFAHAKNSALTALVSGDGEKRQAVARKYGVELALDYADYDRALESVDAVYIATPNTEHADYAVRAAEAGVHVLCEKPLAASVDEATRIVDSCRHHRVKLMTAYRLHFEAINLAVIDAVAGGMIGEPKFFSATFSMAVKPDNIRADRELGGGSVWDLGVYCINAARYVFRAEPKEVLACVVNSDPQKLPEIDESVAAILRFDGEKVATFISSFNSADTSTYRIVGTAGDIVVDPAFEYAEPLAYTLTVGSRKTRKAGKRTDQFAAELVYFSDCITDDRLPEPSGEEGLQDVRIIQAIYESAEIGRAVPLPPYEPAERPSGTQLLQRPPVGKVDLVNVEAAHE